MFSYCQVWRGQNPPLSACSRCVSGLMVNSVLILTQKCEDCVDYCCTNPATSASLDLQRWKAGAVSQGGRSTRVSFLAETPCSQVMQSLVERAERIRKFYVASGLDV